MRILEDKREASAWTKFQLLMWKNYLQQWRHKLQTLAELLIPILVMLLVLVLRWQIEPIIMGTTNYESIPANTLSRSLRVMGGMETNGISIGYSPRSPILEEVVHNAATKLVVQNMDLFSQITANIPTGVKNADPELYNMVGSLINVTAFDSSADFRNVYLDTAETRRLLAIVEFSDSLLGSTELPLDLSYALRFPERPRMNSFFFQGSSTWRTDLLLPSFELAGPRSASNSDGGLDPGYVVEMFIALQHAISLELVSRVAGEDYADFDVHIQRFPHPPYVLDYATEALTFLFPSFVMIGYCYTVVNLVRSITMEKELQLKETMKIMGLPTWLHWMAWFCKQFIYLMIATVAIMIILKVNWFRTEDGFSDYAVFTNTPWSVLFFFLTMYNICTILFCFMLSGFFSKASSAALFSGVIWFLSYLPAFLLSVDVSMSRAAQAFTCLSINSAMAYGIQLMLAQESSGGLQWGEFMTAQTTDHSDLLFGHVLIMLAVNCVIYMLIALYLEQVLPGPYGTPKPWYFLVQKEFWCFNNKIKDFQDINVDDEESNDIIKEKDPTDLPIGVTMQNLTKVFGKHAAVNNLSLKIYDNQITVLLGHNGAGKSTTISMLTGNLQISRGTINVAGYDIAKQANLARRHLGLCPQHNVLFDWLTVSEHLKFFARLKGFSGKELLEEIDVMISKLELDDKRDYQAGGLSGGQKRRLSVGIALCGGASVVLLDEPTSGMDPASRRALWDLLQKEKKGRSMILTTHFMDEADILGDRIAIMAEGRLQCVGSPFFLKRHYSIGYTLVIVKREGFNTDACTALINKYIPGIEVKEDRGSETTYALMNEYSNVFESMLNDLEANTETIKFTNYGLVATNLEDVFMSVGSDVHKSTAKDDVSTSTRTSHGTTANLQRSSNRLNVKVSDKEVTGIRLIWQHTLAIWMKLWLVWIKSPTLVALQILIPLVQLCTTLAIFQFLMSFTESITRRELSLTTGFTNTETLLTYNGSADTSLGSLGKSAYESIYASSDVPSMKLTVVQGRPMDLYYLDRTDDPVLMQQLRNQLLIGATFDDNSATAWFSNFGYHDVATSLATVHEALLKAVNPQATMTIFNHPLMAQYDDGSDPFLSILAMQLASGIGSSLGIISAVFIMFYIKERVSRAKLLQKASGIKPVTMWFSASIFDWIWYSVACVTIIISCAIFQVVGLSTVTELGRLYLCLIIYGAAMIPINYVFSYFFSSHVYGFVAMYFLNVLLGTMGSQIVDALWTPGLTTHEVANVLDAILQFFPLYSLVTSVRLLNNIGLVQWSCKQSCNYILAILPNVEECTMELLCENVSDQCCIEEEHLWYWNDPGIVRYLTCMLVTMVVMWIILMVAEYRLIQKIFNREVKALPLQEHTMDNDVVDEIRHVERIGTGRDQSLVTKSLTKFYGKFLAVDQVSFTVSDTECFGLLGVNGAGKTSTFKMLMGDETISSGDAFVGGDSVKTNITKVYKNIGYCPQFDAVFPELTGRETLKLFSMLRGLRQDNARVESEMLAESLGFLKHLDKRVEHFSGGNKRKLSTAVALLGRTRLAFVDEPTTGVDPAAKRQVWDAIQDSRRTGRGVVMTSHSMEECEALCSRLTIMVNGRFQCLGTPQHLKTKFSQGFTLTIKMKVDDTSNFATLEISDAVKRYVSNNFRDANIMEEYKGLLTYYLGDRSMPWSRMFGIMEAAKRELDIEDYSISQTSLEQIFLQFTKYQR